MPKSYENQKSICIHKPRVTTNFLQIASTEWMQANKTLTPYGLQLYLYLASNTDQYQFALSPAAAEEYAGIKSTTFHKYLRLLEIEGYLVWRKGSLYDFTQRLASQTRERIPTSIVNVSTLRIPLPRRETKSFLRPAKQVKPLREASFRQTKCRYRHASRLLRTPIKK